jgi:hypothetical protein
MSAASVPQPCRRTSIAQRRANAAAKAETLTVDYYLDGDKMIIASATTPGKLYVVTSGDCSCPAGLQELPCKHAEFRLNVLYPRRNHKPQTETEYSTTIDLCDELF